MSAVIAADAAGHSAWALLLAGASAPYRPAGRFAWHFAKGKLGMDPVFRYLIEQGLVAPGARVLDIGCGQGLLASLLHSGAALHRQGLWPSAWAPAPSEIRMTGIELMPRDVRRARVALGQAAEFICGDMRRTPFPEADAVVLLDVLHYISLAEQDELLMRVRRALPAGGSLLLRIGDAGSRRGFALSRWVDAIVSRVRRRQAVPLAGRTLKDWIVQLESLGFHVRSRPMSAGTLFANWLLIAEIPKEAQA